MNRRRWMQTTLYSLLSTGTFALQARAQSGVAADLKQQLESELKARRPEEFEFIEQVVTLVDEGTLPLSLVNSTFLWARKKQPYPFVYFERALRHRAAELGISL